MVNQSENLDYWRRYFQSSNSDLFFIINQAIKLVALDFPNDFKLRRDEIAETLFSCHLDQCIGSDGSENLSPNENDESVTKTKRRTQFKNGVSKENKVTSYGEADALTNEIEKEDLIIREVMRMKMILDNPNETDLNVFNSLRKLQSMDLSVDILKTTEVGKSVNAARKHPNKKIHNVARKLIEVWRKMVEELVHMTTTFVDVTPQFCNPNVANEEEEEMEEEGLPAPPIDNFAFLQTYSSTMELSNFFEEFDEDGNIAELQPITHLNKRRKPDGQTLLKRKEQVQIEQENKGKNSIKKQNFIIKQQKKSSITMESKPQLVRKCTTMLDDRKLDSTKRRLYQEVDEVKKRRTLHAMEMQNLPKQGGTGQRNSHLKIDNSKAKIGQR